MKDEILNTTEVAKHTSELANNFYADLRPIVQPVTKCIGAVLDLAVLPVLYYSQKAQINYKHRLEQYKKKMDAVKDEDRCEVHPEIGVPIMQVLHYTTNDDIAEMFTNLLVSASITSMAGSAHPAFVEIIKQMSPDEAKIVQYLKNGEEIPYISLRVNSSEPIEGFELAVVKAVAINEDVEMMYPQNVQIYISNLLSLGIIADSGDLQLAESSYYDKVIKYHHLDEMKSKYESSHGADNVDYDKGYYHVTEIGKLFIDACCKKCEI